MRKNLHVCHNMEWQRYFGIIRFESDLLLLALLYDIFSDGIAYTESVNIRGERKNDRVKSHLKTPNPSPETLYSLGSEQSEDLFTA